MRQSRYLPILTLCAAAAALSSCGDGDAFPVRTYLLGDRVQLGQLVYTVFETQWLTHMGEGAEARVPENRFFLVRMSATSGAPGTVTIPNFALVNDKGNTYPELSNGDGVPQFIGYLRSVRPAESAQGNALFDVPPGHYKLKVKDETGDKVALIDIPLSFGAETPEILTPGSQKK
jgi:hypothetical protein